MNPNGGGGSSSQFFGMSSGGASLSSATTTTNNMPRRGSSFSITSLGGGNGNSPNNGGSASNLHGSAGGIGAAGQAAHSNYSATTSHNERTLSLFKKYLRPRTQPELFDGDGDDDDSKPKSAADVLKSETPSQALLRQQADIRFGVGMVALTMLRYLTEHMSKLPLAVMSRLLDTHDVLQLLVPLIENPPWTRRNDSVRRLRCRHRQMYGSRRCCTAIRISRNLT